jgi:hypothetical protein
MLSSVLNSDRAVQMNTSSCGPSSAPQSWQQSACRKIEQLERTQKQHGSILVSLVQDIQKLKHPPMTRAIGFVYPKDRTSQALGRRDCGFTS